MRSAFEDVLNRHFTSDELNTADTDTACLRQASNNNSIPNQYIVVLKDHFTRRKDHDAFREIVEEALGGRVLSYFSIINGFCVEFPLNAVCGNRDLLASCLGRVPSIKYIEPNAVATIS